MTVYRQARGGQWKIDFRLGDPFTTSGPDRLQPEAWNTTNGIKVFAHCATVVIGSGNAALSDKHGERSNGKARRKNRRAGIR
jgi:hypothetical protein